MSKYMYERLSAQDNSFLVPEHANMPLHVGAVAVYELGGMASESGGVDVRKFKQALEAQLHRIPRYREKLQWTPIENRPVWVDDPHFNLDYHVRHAALPRPGGIDELKKLVARITTRTLDRSRPLWEMWLIEGLAGDRFAVVNKIHHCMVDGISGADIAQILMSPTPEHEIGEAREFLPRPAPSSSELLLDAAKRLLLAPVDLLGRFTRFSRETTDLLGEVGARIGAIADLGQNLLAPASRTPLNGTLGPHRRVDWLTLPLDDVKAVRRAAGCSVNDVVLATVSGAVRQYLLRRGIRPTDIDFRVSAPVSVRDREENGTLGNRVSAWIIPLPIDEATPAGALDRVNLETRKCKASRQAVGLELLMQVAEYAPPSLFSLGARAAAGPMNMIVTNVPGPQFPLYMLGARLLEMHPLVPLLDGTGLGIALFSYDGKLHVGLNADYDLVPDLGTFTAFFAQSFMALVDATGAYAYEEPTTPSADVSADVVPLSAARNQAVGGMPIR